MSPEAAHMRRSDQIGPRGAVILVSPGCFRGTLTPSGAARCMVQGVRRVDRDLPCVVHPMADGGDGFVDVLAWHGLGCVHRVPVSGPSGEEVVASYLVSHDGTTAFIEMAQASGLGASGASEVELSRRSTRGTGQLIADALDKGARRVVLGAGGSATFDLGAGALEALGVRFYDLQAGSLAACPAALERLDSICLQALDSRVPQTRFEVWSDVSVSVLESASKFGPQKGASHADVALFHRCAEMLVACLPTRSRACLAEPYLGAGGGIGFLFSQLLQAEVKPGAQSVALATGLDLSHGFGLVLTGEGRWDATSFLGKTPFEVSRLSKLAGVPCAVVAGSVASIARAGLPANVSLWSLAEANSERGAGERLETGVAAAVRHWYGRGGA